MAEGEAVVCVVPLSRPLAMPPCTLSLRPTQSLPENRSIARSAPSILLVKEPVDSLAAFFAVVAEGCEMVVCKHRQMNAQLA